MLLFLFVVLPSAKRKGSFGTIVILKLSTFTTLLSPYLLVFGGDGMIELGSEKWS